MVLRPQEKFSPSQGEGLELAGGDWAPGASPEVQLTGGKAGELFCFDMLACRTTSVSDLGVFPEFGIFTWTALVEVKGTSTMTKFEIQNENLLKKLGILQYVI